MFWTKFNKSTRTILYCLSCLILVTFVIWFGVSTNSVNAGSERDAQEGEGSTFSGSGAGNIPDGTPGLPQNPTTPLEITFDVTGISGNPSSVSINMNISHTYMGDIDATLISPNGTSFTIFGYTGADGVGFGDSSILGGIYNFTDSASPPNWWVAAEDAGFGELMPPGNYRTTEKGGPGQIFPAPDTNLSAAFSGEDTPNGTWTLSITDGAGEDTGSVSAASLTIGSGGTVAANNPEVDFDGDGKSDYSVVRDETPDNFRRNINPQKKFHSVRELVKNPGAKSLNSLVRNVAPSDHGTTLSWYIRNSQSATARVQGHGQGLSDFWVPEDYDGDGVDDLAVWRGVSVGQPSNNGFFYTLTSSNNLVSEIEFGQLGDNPKIVGDYDGDGKADPAVYRCPVGGGECTFFFKGSAGSGEITYAPWGFGNNDLGVPADQMIRPYPGDFDGDGKNDFCVYKDGLYTLLKSSDQGVEYIRWGLASDFAIMTGDYDGDGKTDFMNARLNSDDNVEWWLLERDGAESTTTWGATIPGFDEGLTPGDFDGDGSTDIAAWRRNNSNSTGSFFYVLRSSDGMVEIVEWGSAGDAPVPGWNFN